MKTINNNTKQAERYINACTRSEYLYIKLCYDVNGLSPDEFAEYKAATK